MREVTTAQAAQMLREADDILILTHQYPDGDTLGCAFAMCRGLLSMGKRARVVCSDPIPQKYSYLYHDMKECAFEPGFILAVDVADAPLLGSGLSEYADRVDLCIDHHHSNTKYAANLLLKEYAAAAEVVFEVLLELDVTIDEDIAAAIYTGISTDTGCFKYANTTAQSHAIAAQMMRVGIDTYPINRLMFEIKSRARFEIERLALESVEYYFDGICAVMYITKQMLQKSKALESDLDGLTPIPRQIDGVQIGVTLREKIDGAWKISVRTGAEFNASSICGRLGGGGHMRAAGCTVTGTAREACDKILKEIAAEREDERNSVH